MTKRKPEEYVGLGLVFGIVGGIIFDNLALGICFGLVGGAALAAKARKERGEDEGAED